ncbi:hypothetical protein Agabi119p4_8961 [Agaricus bisporus var. burnettii]|uniref:Uncharacterized protein n=1 Tax=Agaricus bisporus var. burnettii TaxID=192524 RepID=A0A8H7EXJ1_AGABI|nr:hypothetical protein Agabi119p4_8961 [Agaricus bisporus var. burnettii]
MTTLVPIVNIVNSNHERLGFHIANGRGCWRASICYGVGETERFLDDLIKHIRRVRGFCVKVSEKELELWQILHTLLMPRSMVYLLPCLQRLSLVSADDPQSHPFLAVISYIFAPSLTSVRVKESWGSSWNTVQQFMNSHHTPNFSQLHYLDETLDDLLSGVGHLRSL